MKKRNDAIKSRKLISHDEFLEKELSRRHITRESFDAVKMEFVFHRTYIEAREKKGLTQKELAANLGIAQPALARFESGKSNPTVASLSKFLLALGLKLKIVPA